MDNFESNFMSAIAPVIASSDYTPMAGGTYTFTSNIGPIVVMTEHIPPEARYVVTVLLDGDLVDLSPRGKAQIADMIVSRVQSDNRAGAVNEAGINKAKLAEKLKGLVA